MIASPERWKLAAPLSAGYAAFYSPHALRRDGAARRRGEGEAMAELGLPRVQAMAIEIPSGFLSAGEERSLGVALQQTANPVHDRLELPREGAEAVPGGETQGFLRERRQEFGDLRRPHTHRHRGRDI